MDESKWYDDPEFQKEIDESIEMANSARIHKELMNEVSSIVNSSFDSDCDELLKQNVSRYGAEKIESPIGKKRISKEKFKKIALGIVKRGLSSLIALMIVIGASNIVVNLTKKNKEIKTEVDYINSLVIPDVVYELKKDGFSENSIMYYIKQTYGYDGLDVAARKKGYVDGGEYIIGQGFKDEVKSSNGETTYYDLPEEKEFFKVSKAMFNDEIAEMGESLDSVRFNSIPDIYEYLISNGFSEETTMYYIKKEYGNKGLDAATQSLGFKDGGEYIISLGFKDEVRSSNGETVYYELPDETKYEKEMREVFLNEIANRKTSRKGL